MRDHSTNGHGGRSPTTRLEARETRRRFHEMLGEPGSPWEYDGRGPALCGSFCLGDGAVCCDRCLIEAVGRDAPAMGIHPHLEVCDAKMRLTLTPELGSEEDLSLAALRFALEFDGLAPAGQGG